MRPFMGFSKHGLNHKPFYYILEYEAIFGVFCLLIFDFSLCTRSPLEPEPTTTLPDRKLLVFILDRLQKREGYSCCFI
ncbi:hypothetical protein Hanom_Chr03g00247621 [Helianthus anomalus]